MSHALIDPVDPKEYDFAYNLLHDFFRSQGFIKGAFQHRKSIMAACEDPFNLAILNYLGQPWPSPQTNQMWMEVELLKNPDFPGLYCETTSHRNEPDPIPGRHNLAFPMFEFETHDGMDVLKAILINLLEFAGFKRPFSGGSYVDVADRYGVEELTGEHEEMIAEDFGPVFFLEHFPEHTDPFWNMKRDGDTANKIDVILHGIETIGSAERSINPEEMRDRFYSIKGGAYVKQLYREFTKERVDRELEEFLELPFIPRCGGGIGMNRFIRALKLSGILKT